MKLIILIGLLQVTWALPMWQMDPYYHYDPYNLYNPYWMYMDDQMAEPVADVQGRDNHQSAENPGSETVDLVPEDRGLATKLQSLSDFKFFVQNWPTILRQAMVQLAPVRLVPASSLSQPDKIIIPVPFQFLRPVGIGSNNVVVNLPLNK